MSDKKYKVIVSDRAKRMLGTHICFMAQVNKDAVKAKKQELMEAMRFLERMPQRFPFFEETYIPTNKYHKMILEIVYGAAVMVIGLAELIQNPVLIFL
ncbi:type II toxin-antitoxin system RelE/ParE family toxin [Eubacterium ramulus]